MPTGVVNALKPHHVPNGVIATPLAVPLLPWSPLVTTHLRSISQFDNAGKPIAAVDARPHSQPHSRKPRNTLHILKRTLALLVLGTCCATFNIAHAYHLSKEEADIRLIDGSPAICLPKSAWRRFPVSEVLMMEPYTRTGKWSVRLKDGAKPMKLRPGKCVSYGSTPAGYERAESGENKETFSLKPNTIYYFEMTRVIPILWYMPTAIYEATFCLKEDADGTFSIQKESACAASSR